MQLGAYIDGGLFQTRPKIGQTDSQSNQRQDGIDRQLTWSMEQAATPAVQPANFNLSRNEIDWVTKNVSLTPLSPQREQRRMFAEQQSPRLSLLISQALDQSLLQE